MQKFMLPYYMGYGDGYEIQNSDTFYVGLLDCFTVPYYTLPDNLESLKGNLGDLSELEEEYREYVYQMYLTLDEETRTYMQGLITEQGFDANDPRIIKTVARYVQNAAEYDLKYDVAMDSEPNVAIAFLSTYKKGICVHYASAATLLFRALGIPARYVEGFMVETKAGTFVDIKTPGHAWVEVYVDGIGWIQVEVTGSTNDGSGSDQGPDDIPCEKLSLEIMPSYQWKLYDGEPLVARPEIEMNLVLADLLSQGYTYVANVTGEQTEVGLGISTITDFTLYDANMQDVTARYDLVYKEGVLEVLEPEKEIIRVYLHQIQKYYDGTALSFEEEDYSIIEIPDGVTLELDLHISLTDVGTITLSEINGDIDTYATYRVYRDGADVTDRFVLVFDVLNQSATYLPIRVDKRVITVTSGSQTKIYDGEPLTNDAVDVSLGKLVDGHYLDAQVSGSIIDVGEQENFIEIIIIRDASGADVTDFYEINLVHGKLTILSPDT